MTTTIINQAQNLIAQGLFNEARKTLQKSIKENTHDANHWYLLGTCNANLGRYAEAEKNFKKAVNLAPLATQAWSNLGLACLHQEKNTAAVSHFKQAIKIDNNFIDALYNLSVTYHKIKQLDKAIKYARKAIKANKNHFQSHNILGLCLQETDIDRAITSFKTAIQLNKHFFDAWHNLIDTYIAHNKNTEAEHTITTALSLFDKNISLYKRLAELQELQNKYDKALSIYNQALVIDSSNIEIQIGIARSHLATSEFNKCESILNKILLTTPDHIDAIIEKCSLLIAQRKYQDAHVLLNTVLAKAKDKPELIIIYANVCKLLGKDKNNTAIDSLINLTHKNLPKKILQPAHFSLADIHDKNGNYEKAFQQYEIANNIFNEKTDIHYYKNTITSIISNLDKETLSSLPHSSTPSKAPVFIVGMPRSGTTLVEQILSSHPDVYGAGEITDLWAIGNQISGSMNLIEYTKNIQQLSKDKLEQYSLEYLKTIQRLSNNAKRCTDKLPHNFFHIGLIGLLFPDAKIIHCQRHPFDTCLSIYFKNFNTNHRYARNLKEIAIFYKNYQLLMQHWYENSPLNIYDAIYENIIVEPEKNIRELVRYIDIEWADTCLKHHESNRLIMTPSHDQASKPLYTSSINRWKNYIHHIKPLRDILGDPEEYL